MPSFTRESGGTLHVAVMGVNRIGKEFSNTLHLDFLDRGRIATWVRSHPALIIWIKNRIGHSLIGWRSYGNWTWLPEGAADQYLLDDRIRMFDGTEPGNEGISSLEGLHRLRTILSAPGRSVRLAGLSGVGKTRFVQALFDDRVGEQALDKSEAFYADVAEGPDPDPNALIEQLTVQQSRSIIILDNCPPILHRQATNICTQASSTVSLVTVEYDVRDDLPPETSVFRLEPASDDLIKKLIESHCPHVSQVDARTIAEVSGGNANIAIALANTVSSGETLSGLRDDELFRRLFTQRESDPISLDTELA